jgi:hypothetical protein
MHYAQKRRAGDVASKTANRTRLEIDDERIAKTFIHEGNPCIIRRNIGTLAEMSQYLDIFWQMIERIAAFPRRGHRDGRQQGKCNDRRNELRWARHPHQHIEPWRDAQSKTVGNARYGSIH